MEWKEIIGYVIAFVAVTGGLGIGFVVVWIGIKTGSLEKIAQLEARHKERLALIEKGLDPTLFDKKINRGHSYGPLLWGCLLIGVGLGCTIGYFIAKAFGFNESLLCNSLALFFGGIGLLIYYIIKVKLEGKKA